MSRPRVDPIRQYVPVSGEKRRRLESARAELEQRITELEAQIHALAAERLELVEQRRAIHRRLWLNLAKRGRRGLPDGRHSLPPLLPGATMLWGRRLRAACRTVLARRGPLPLVELHAELHRLGYGIEHHHPVKALADALGYETREGRTQRVERGTYRLVANATQRRAG